MSDGYAAMMAGDHNAAIALYSQVIESGHLTREGLAVVFHNRGTAFHSLGDYRRAIQDYDTALRYQPPDAYIDHTNRGRAHFELGEYQQSIADFDTALGLNASYAEAYFERGRAYEAIGDAQLAAQDFSRAVSLDPNNPEFQQKAR